MNKKSTPGKLVISLDFELIWGVFDVMDVKEDRQYFLNTRKIIPSLLDLFVEHNIRCTWATVGMLFNKDWEEWRRNQPSVLPTYANQKFSPYQFVERLKEVDHLEIFFAPDLIKRISKSPGQEIGSHTYSHFYCQERGQNLDQFEADLKQAIRVAKEMEIKLSSLVFPRNQFNSSYLSICWNLGITSVRSNPEVWYWNNPASESFKIKFMRTADAYLPLFRDKSYPHSEIKMKKELPMEQKASRFLRPIEKNKLLRALKINRIKSEMTRAAQAGDLYHIWWHPHNFGQSPQESLTDLKHILEHFVELHKKFGFLSVNMQDLALGFIK